MRFVLVIIIESCTTLLSITLYFFYLKQRSSSVGVLNCANIFVIYINRINRSSQPELIRHKDVLKTFQNVQENICVRVSFLKNLCA